VSRFPLDGAFAELRKEVEGATDAMRDFRLGMGGRDAVGRFLPGGGGSGGGSGGGGGGDAGIGALIPKAVDSLKFSELLRNFRETVKGLQAFGSVAKALGFEGAGRELEKMSTRLKLVGELTSGAVAAAKFLKGGFAEAAGAIAVAVAGLIALDVAADQASGTTSSLGEKFALAGLQALKAWQSVKTVLDLVFERENASRSLDALARNQAELKATEDSLDSLEDKIAKRGAAPAFTLDNVKKKVVADFAEISAGIADPIQRALAVLDAAAATQTRQSDNKPIDPFQADPTKFEQFQEQLARMGDVTQGAFDFIASGAQQLSGTISSAILDGFLDPQADIRSSFASLFRALAQQLLQLLTQALLVKAIAGIGGASAGASPAPATSSRARAAPSPRPVRPSASPPAASSTVRAPDRSPGCTRPTSSLRAWRSVSTSSRWTRSCTTAARSSRRSA
jgi:hypothetical protein